MSMVDSLIAWWSLDEESGTRVDLHGSNDLSQTGTVGYVTGIKGNCVDFVPTDYLSIADNDDISTGDIDFSWISWVNPDSVAAHQYLINKYNTTSDGEYFIDFFLSTSRFSFLVTDGGGNFGRIQATSFGLPSVGNWYFIVAEHDATANTISIQINNGAIDSVAYTYGANNSNEALFLGVTSGGGFPFNGQMDETALFKQTLNAGERSWLYNGGKGRSYLELFNLGQGVAITPALML